MRAPCSSHGSYVSDPAVADVLKLFCRGDSRRSVLYTRVTILRQNELLRGEYYVLGLFGLLGMMIMMSANSFLTVYLGLETAGPVSVCPGRVSTAIQNSGAGGRDEVLRAGRDSRPACCCTASRWVYGVNRSACQFPEVAAA